MAKAFLAGAGLEVDTGCFAIAAPVIAGSAKMTNLPWVTEAATVANVLGLRDVHLLNDLEAIAIAVPALTAGDLYTLNPGTPVPGGAISVIAPGTGLGEAYLTWDGPRYQAHASEGGHADFAPTDPLQIGLLQFLMKRYDHVSFERVCSGIGIPNIYDYLREIRHAPESPPLAAALAEAEDRTPLIVEAALNKPDENPLCTATLEMFLSILGAEAGNLALKIWSTGGVFLAGGIPPRMPTALANGTFMRAFKRKGRFTELLAHTPVHVVVVPAGIIGAAIHGLEMAANR